MSGPVPLPVMDETPAAPATMTTPNRSRWATIGWIACSALLIAVVLGVWLRMDSERSGSNLANAIVQGERPAAPALPTAAIAGDGAPGLPAWYRTSGDEQIGATGGKVLVVNWWASWCGPCEDEAPELRELSDDYAGRVVVVGLNAGSEDLESDARDFVRKHDLTFPIVRGGRADNDAWGVNSYPETFVVGTDGRVSAHISGPIEASDMRELLDDELAKDRGAS